MLSNNIKYVSQGGFCYALAIGAAYGTSCISKRIVKHLYQAELLKKAELVSHLYQEKGTFEIPKTDSFQRKFVQKALNKAPVIIGLSVLALSLRYFYK